MQSVRTFICFQLPAFARQQLVAIQQRLRQSGAHVGWVKPENIHLTIKFLGSVPTGRLDGVSQSVRRAVDREAPFELELTELGFFPNNRDPKVIWTGPGRLPEPLQVLHRRVEEEMVAVGFAPDARPFSPHFTLGRVRSGRNILKLAAAVEAERFQPLRFSLTEMVVMGSKLHPGGALYTPISRISLDASTAGA